MIVGLIGMIVSYGIVGGIRKTNDVIFGFDFDDFNIFTTTEAIQQNGTFVSEGLIFAVEIDMTAAETTIKRSQEDKVTVDYRTNDKDCNFSFKEENGMLYIEQKYVFSIGFNIDWNNSSSMDIFLPDRMYNSFVLNMTSGKFTNQVPIQAGEIELNITSGMLDLYDLKASRNLNIEITSGDIRASKLKTEDFNFDMTSGNCEFLHLSTGRNTLETVSGNAIMYFDDWRGETDIDMTAGFLGLYLPPGTGANLKLDRLSGEVYDETSKTSYEDDGEYAFGGSLRQNMSVNILSGNVRFGENNKTAATVAETDSDHIVHIEAVETVE
jgi:DUF4097 and DUF4098 domain-containing protein YvlB